MDILEIQIEHVAIAEGKRQPPLVCPFEQMQAIARSIHVFDLGCGVQRCLKSCGAAGLEKLAQSLVPELLDHQPHTASPKRSVLRNGRHWLRGMR